MTVELMRTISLVSFIAAGVFFLVAVALFFLLDIKRVIGDVSGSTARKAIENIRQQNEESGDKAYKPSAVNQARGKVTEKISPSGRLKNQQNALSVAVGTSKLAKNGNPPAPASPAAESNATTVLNSTPAQEPQSGNETTVLGASDTSSVSAANETTILNTFEATAPSGSETTILSQPAPAQQSFLVDYEIGFCGSTEIIS